MFLTALAWQDTLGQTARFARRVWRANTSRVQGRGLALNALETRTALLPALISKTAHAMPAFRARMAETAPRVRRENTKAALGRVLVRNAPSNPRRRHLSSNVKVILLIQNFNMVDMNIQQKENYRN